MPKSENGVKSSVCGSRSAEWIDELPETPTALGLEEILASTRQAAPSHTSAIHSQEAESPMSRQLRLEANRDSSQVVQEPETSSTLLLKRPESHGNDTHPIPFALGPMYNKQTSGPPSLPIISFAPIHLHVKKEDTTSLCSLVSTQESRARSHMLSKSPQPASSLPTLPGERARPFPETGEKDPPDEAQEAPIQIRGDRDEMITEEEENTVQVEEHFKKGQALGDVDATKSDENLRHKAGSVQSEAVENSTNTHHQQPPLPPPTQNGPASGNGVRTTARPGSGTFQSSSPPITPHRRRSSSILLTPARVAKRKDRPQSRLVETRPVRMPQEFLVPSEEDLLFVVMHRSREREKAALKAKKEIRNLEHRNFNLHAEITKARQERDDITSAHTELDEKHKTLQTRLEDFRTKYYKLKDFALSARTDLLDLRKAADMQNASMQDLKQIEQQVKTSLQEARTSVQSARSSLQKQTRGLAVIRSETNQVFSKLSEATLDANTKSGRLKEMQREKARLEAHIIGLEHARQRSDYAANELTSEITSALTKMGLRLDSFDSATLLPPQLPKELEDRLAHLIASQEKQQGALAEISELSATVIALNDAVSEGVSNIDKSFTALINAQKLELPQQVLNNLKSYVEEVKLQILEAKRSTAEKASMEERLKASESMNEQLLKSLAQAESHATTFQKGMESSTRVSDAQQERLGQLEHQRDQFQVRWNQTASDLAKLKEELSGKNQEKALELEQFEALLIHEGERKIREIQETTGAEHALFERILEDTTRGFLTELEHRRLAEAAAQRENDEAYALISQDFDQLRRANDSQDSTNSQLKATQISLEATINRLRANITSLQSRNAGLQSENDSLRSANASLESTNNCIRETNSSLSSTNDSLLSTNKKIQSDIQSLQQAYTNMQEQRDEALTKVQNANKMVSQLHEVQKLYEATRVEAYQLRVTKSQLLGLQEQFESLQKESNSKTSEASSLKQKLAEMENYPVTVVELKKKIEKSEAERKELHDKLSVTSFKAKQVDQLKAGILSKSTTIEKLEADLIVKLQLQEQLQKVTQEKDTLTQDLSRLRNDMEAIQEQLRNNADLAEHLEQKDREIGKLQQLASREDELLQCLEAHKETSQRKDAQLASLRLDLIRAKAESQASADGPASDLGTQLNELDGFPSQQTDLSFLQSQPQPLHSIASPESVVQPQLEKGERSARKVADRSGRPRPAAKPESQSQEPPEGSQPQSTNDTDLIPDSQAVYTLQDVLGTYPSGKSKVRQSSPLSSIGSGDEEAIPFDESGLQSSPLEIPETLQDRVLPPTVDQAFQPQVGSRIIRERSSVRPSSAMTEDLFKQHATNLDSTGVEQRTRKESGSNSDISRSTGGHTHPSSVLRPTVGPKDLRPDPPSHTPSISTSPKHLRSGTHFGQRSSTPGQTTAPSNGTRNTPGSHKGQHQPNSAVKRSAEDEFPPPKRPRRPENLDVRPSPKPKKMLSSEVNSTNSDFGLTRKSGSVVGTPAPAPGKSQKSSKTMRTGSTKDKYAKRFSQQS